MSYPFDLAPIFGSYVLDAAIIRHYEAETAWIGDHLGRLGRDLQKRKLAKLLGSTLDEAIFSSIAAIAALQAGNRSALSAFVDYPEKSIGSKLGSDHFIPLWSLETLINELLCTPKQLPMLKQLNYDRYSNFRVLTSLIAKLENAEDGMFLAKHNVFTEMHRIGQRQRSNPTHTIKLRTAPDTYSQNATLRHSMLSRILASAKLESRNAVCGQRQVRV